MKRYKLKTRREVKGTATWREGFSKNEQLLEIFVERVEESKRRTKVATQKRQSYIEIEKNKAQEMEKKQKKDLERQENVSSKMRVTLEIKTKWLQGCH